MRVRYSYSRLTVYSPWRVSKRSVRATRTAGRLYLGYKLAHLARGRELRTFVTTQNAF